MENTEYLKRILLNMNYDSKNTLSENVEKIMLNEAGIVKNFTITRKTNPNSTALQDFTIPKGSPIIKRGSDVEIGSANSATFFTYSCDDKNFRYEGTLSGSAGAKYSNDELGDMLDNDYCRVKTDDEKADDTFWKKGEDPSGYWVELYNVLIASGYQFKLLNKDKKATTNIKIATQMWWKNFIINRNLAKYVIISVGEPTIAYATLQKKYAGEKDLTNVILKMGKGFVGSDFMSLKNFLDTDWKAVPKKDEKVIDYTQEKKKKGGGGNVPPVSSSWNTTCKGTYSMGCNTPEVGQAQQCLKDANLYPYRVDNKFGKLTRNAVNAKIGKSSFTDADLQTICKAKEGSGGNDFDRDMGVVSDEKEKEDTTWTGNVY